MNAQTHAIAQFEITSDLFGDGIATIDDIMSMLPDYDGWDIDVEHTGTELRMTAERYDATTDTPSRYDNWTMTTDDYGYMIIGEIAD